MLPRATAAVVLCLALAADGAAEPVRDGSRRHARWIRIDIPAFSLQVLDGAEVVLEMPVVVGRPSRPTPVFEKPLSAIVVNPPWTIPPDLAFHDLLPKILAEPGHLARRGIDVYEGWHPGAARLDAARIDWKRLGRRIEALMLRQRPGPGNGLGRLMFRMDGEHEIFLHDTPAREVFRRRQRALSSGCIRLADAEGLAHAVLDAAGVAQLGSALARGETTTITLSRPVLVRTVYETVWVDRHGGEHTRDDVYATRTRAAARHAPPAGTARGTPTRVVTAVPLLSAAGSGPPRSARRTAAAAR